MAANPVVISDEYTTKYGDKTQERALSIQPRQMNFGGLKGDTDRKKRMDEVNCLIDNSVTVGESVAFELRPRDKSKEVGASMHLNNHFQVERLANTLENAGLTCTVEEAFGQGNLTNKIRKYRETGRFKYPSL